MENLQYPAAGIKAARERLGISQSELARRIGKAPCDVCNWEAGRGGSSKESLLLLADALETTVDSLLGRTISAQTSAPVNACPAEDTVKP